MFYPQKNRIQKPPAQNKKIYHSLFILINGPGKFWQGKKLGKPQLIPVGKQGWLLAQEGRAGQFVPGKCV